jgi:hypothetical protein
MRIIKAAVLIASGAIFSWAPAWADMVPEFKGNDTGGIIAYTLASRVDGRQLAVDAQYGGYVSFSCRWVPYGANDRPIRTLY